MSKSPQIEAHSAGKIFSDFNALRDVSLSVKEGEFLSLLSPSGSGKTTFLTMLGGYQNLTSGKLLFEGQDMTDWSAKQRGLPNGDWSWPHYQSLLENPEWGHSVMTSLQVGVLASLLSVALATAFCVGLWVLRPPFAMLMTGFVLLPMVAPPVVSSLTLFFFLTQLSQWNSLTAYDTLGGVVMAHMVMIVPYAVVVIMVSLSQVDRRMDLAAQSMGANLITRIFSVILPNIRFGMLGALFLCFLLSWDEIGVTLFVTSVETITLPRRMWMGLRDTVDPAIASISVLLILMITLVIVARSVVLWRKVRGSS